MNVYEKWCKQLGIEPLPNYDKPITEHPDVQKLIIQYSQLQTKYDTLKASHAKLVEACEAGIKLSLRCNHPRKYALKHEIEQALKEAKEI